MSSLQTKLALALVGVLAFAAPSFAADSAAPTGTPTKALVALLQIDKETIRSVGVTKVTHPGKGVYCVKPSVALDFTAIYPQVTVEWGNSSGTDLLAFVQDAAPNCVAGYLEVRTYDFSTGTPLLSNNVAFFLVVD